MRDENSTIELIKRYKELLDAGAITQGEFDRKKAALLNSSSSPDDVGNGKDFDDGELDAEGFVNYDSGLKRNIKQRNGETQGNARSAQRTRSGRDSIDRPIDDRLPEDRALSYRPAADRPPARREPAYEPREYREPRYEQRYREPPRTPPDRGYYKAELPPMQYSGGTRYYDDRSAGMRNKSCFGQALKWIGLTAAGLVIAVFIFAALDDGSDLVDENKSEQTDSIELTENIQYDAELGIVSSTEVQYKLNSGELLEITEDERDGLQVLIIKAKITSQSTNKLTIEQNYHNVYDLITNQGCDKFDEIQYLAVADMEDGSEQRVISFTLKKSAIQGIEDGNILPVELEPKLDDLWLISSLRDEQNDNPKHTKEEVQKIFKQYKKELKSVDGYSELEKNITKIYLEETDDGQYIVIMNLNIDGATTYCMLNSTEWTELKKIADNLSLSMRFYFISKDYNEISGAVNILNDVNNDRVLYVSYNGVGIDAILQQ